MGKTIIAGWIVTVIGTALWIYGYFAKGNPPLINWQAQTPWWIADYLPNIESEIGLVLVCVGAVVTYWPT